MSRSRVAVILSTVLVGLLILASVPVFAGCHGGCVGGLPGTPTTSCGGDTFLVDNLLDMVATGAEPSTNLELYSMTLLPDVNSDSEIYEGEATAFYVASGTIAFTIDASVATGTARVSTVQFDVPREAGEHEELVAGDALLVGAQDHRVKIRYQNEGSTEAVLVIASAVPCFGATPSASPS